MALTDKTIGCLITALGALACSMAMAAQERSPILGEAQEEEFLRTAAIVRNRPINEGVTNSMRLTLEKNGFTHDAQLQTVNISQTRFQSSHGAEINFRDSYKYNIGAYELAKLLGIDDMIPPSIERKVAGSTGAVTWWVDDVLMEEAKRLRSKTQPPDKDHWNQQMQVVRVFDQLIYNTDRNLANLLIDKLWNLWMIDHTRAFRLYRELPNEKNLTRCDRTLLARLRELNKAALKEKLGRYLTGLEIDGLLGRRDQIVSFFEKAVKEQGEAEVLYDRTRRN